MPAIETARLLLRRLGPEDLDVYYERIYADPEVMRFLPSREPVSRREFDDRIPGVMIDHWQRHGFGPWAVIHKDDRRLIGHCGLRYWPQTTDVEVLYALDRRYWGRGLATEGATASLRYGFETLRLRRIIAAAFTGNAGSRRVLDKIGMRFEGTFTFAGREAARYAITRREHRSGAEPYQLLP